MKTVTKKMLNAIKVAEKKGIREALKGIYFDGEKVAATNGYVLVEIESNGIESSEFPGTAENPPVSKLEPCILDSKGIESVLKNMPKNRSLLPVLETALVSGETEGEIKMTVNDLEVKNEISIKKIKAQFPDYKSIFPKTAPKASVAVNKQYLLQLIDQFEDDNVVIHLFDGIDTPIAVTPCSEQDKGVRGVVMPLNARSADLAKFLPYQYQD